jgi:tripartite-type tricarboxylate transporter receptor subunit TctC
MKTLLGRLILAGLLMAGPLLASLDARADTYPDRTVTDVVTSAAGALTDVLTRAVGQKLSEKWKESVVVENRGGAGHSLAAMAVKSAPHDGYTLLASETGFYTSQPHLYAKGKFSFDAQSDFIPVAGYAGIPEAVLVNPSLGVTSMKELIALARNKPGGLNYGTAGVGTALHTAALLLQSLANIKMTAVHYRGAAPALNDLLAGHINVVIMGPSVALPAVKAGKLRMLAFASETRVPQFPDVPTVAETVPGFAASVSFGLFAPKGTPPAVIAKINADVQQAIGEPAFRKRFLEPLVVQPLPGSQQAFAGYLDKESAKWAKVIKAANLKIE